MMHSDMVALCEWLLIVFRIIKSVVILCVRIYMDVPCRFFYHHICETQPLLVYKHASDYYPVPFLLSPLLLVKLVLSYLSIDDNVSVSPEVV
jgi:hypothetical protein